MSDEELLIEVAKLDGKEYHKPTEEEVKRGSYYQYEPDYLTSRDAVVPVIEKQFSNDTQRSDFICTLGDICRSENKNWWAWTTLTATPRQLCLALLKATGRYKE